VRRRTRRTPNNNYVISLSIEANRFSNCASKTLGNSIRSAFTENKSAITKSRNARKSTYLEIFISRTIKFVLKRLRNFNYNSNTINKLSD